MRQVDLCDPMTSRTESDDCHARLNELRTATIRRAASLVSSFDGIVEATSDVATDDEHDPEGHTIAWERQQIAALLDETRHRRSPTSRPPSNASMTGCTEPARPAVSRSQSSAWMHFQPRRPASTAPVEARRRRACATDRTPQHKPPVSALRQENAR